MAGFFRSVDMCQCQMLLQTESAFSCVSELGKLENVMFKDMNSNVNMFQRKFIKEVRRCEEIERKMRYLKREIETEDIAILEFPEVAHALNPRDLNAVESELAKMEQNIREISTNHENLRASRMELIGLKNVLLTAQMFFQDFQDSNRMAPQNRRSSGADAESEQMEAPGIRMKERTPAGLVCIAGVINRDRVHGFERMLWRVSRGNAFLRTAEIQKFMWDSMGVPVTKCVFFIFLQGDQLKTRVHKICQAYHASIIPCPEKAEERQEMLLSLLTRFEDLGKILQQTRDHHRHLLIAAARELNCWTSAICKIKAIYHTLNMFSLDVSQNYLIAECWIPTDQMEEIRAALKRGSEIAGSSFPSILNKLETDHSPPTYYRLNKFTKGFQGLVDAYGTSSYREINPAPCTIVTFPFLFGVMFGDVGHGLIMFMFALWLVLKEKSIKKSAQGSEILSLFYAGRYIILLMSIFSIYTGIIYNEFFSKSFNIFGSSWKVNFSDKTLTDSALLTLDPNTQNSKDYLGYPYPFGIDPMWADAENKLLLLNSYKMKISVILGVSQMIMGLILSLCNHIYRKSILDIFGIFLPQFIFLCSIFVYLCILIIFKWTYLGANSRVTPIGIYPGPICAPHLIISLISMFMFKEQNMGWHTGNGTTQASSDCAEAYIFPGQDVLQKVLVIIAILCIPWMLFAKPIGQKVLQMRKLKARLLNNPIEGDSGVVVSENHGIDAGHDHETGSDAFIYSGIHTIEFCLGCISHTASYLRLWALSLAHSQLSEVLWTEIMQQFGFRLLRGWAGVFMIFIFWWIFIALTVAILVVMEGLSAFLHALRLHWVEFNSKFFQGEGEPFLPFSFRKVLADAKANED